MKTVCCVLRTGGIYGAEHVRLLKHQLDRHIHAPFEFVCLSDIEIDGIKTIPLAHNLKGYWNKLEIFKHFKNALYFDLDLVITGDITELLSYKGFWAADTGGTNFVKNLNSSVLIWDDDYSHLLDEFLKDQEGFDSEYSTRFRWGDQAFIAERVEKVNLLENGTLHSYWFNLPMGRIVNFCGSMKIWDKIPVWKELLERLK
jgi:hypothetical protein